MPDQVNASGPMYRPSREDRDGVDSGLIRTLFIVGGIAATAIAGYAVYTFAHRSSGGVPVVQADPRPIRVKPDNPGGMAVAPEEQPVVPGASRLAPGTEEPNPRALSVGSDQARTPAAPPVPSPQHAKMVVVQIAAAKSEADARAVWEKLAKKMPDLISDRRPLFLKTNETGPTPWRLRAGGFADAARAKAFCDQVRAKGGTCAVIES